ncbi:MAG: AMP-binding protein [Candidatus Cloacimonetes bacterium]|nr:AMP-binding protein [Candidatus Cloacimonadota bacterium]
MMKRNLVKMFEETIRKNWDLPAFSNYKGETYKYSDVADKIVFLHHLFRNMGIKRGDKISVIGINSTNWAIVYLSVVTYGAVIVPILPDFKPADIHHIVNHSDSVLFFAADTIFENLDETSMPNLPAIFSLTDLSVLHSNKKNLNIIIEKTEKSYLEKYDGKLTAEKLEFDEVNNSELVSIIYTSGTTGFSKGVMLLHNNLAANIVFAQEHMPLQPGETIVSFLPVAHVFGCVFEFLFPVTCGCHITFLGKIPSPKVLIKAFDEIHPRLILSVPLVIEKIYKKQVKPTLEKGSMKILLKIPFMRKVIYKKVNAKLTEVFGGNFREIVIGGAALNEEVEQFLRNIGFRYTVGYGMTECAPLISYTSCKDFKKASTGQIVDTMEVKIDSKDPYNEVGEILVRGENVMCGYYKYEDASKEALDTDGWLHTGDLGVIDKENFIFIKGRCKSMILGPSGKNIYPEEIEAKLNNMPFVMESIIIEKDGKLIALVYPDMEAVDTNKVSERELVNIMTDNRKQLNLHLPGYMNITRIEIYPEEFEKTPKKSIKRFLYAT